MTDKLISVLIPTYNRPKWLDASLESVALQSEVNIQLVILNNGSTDGDTNDVIRKWLPCFDSPLVLHSEHNDIQNVPKLMHHATGDYIVEFSDDDIMLPGNLRSLAQALDNNPRAGIAFGSAAFMDEDGFATGDEVGTCPTSGFTFDDMFADCMICKSSVMLSRGASNVRPTFPFSIDPAGEWARYLEILHQGFESVYTGETGIYYRVHDGSDTCQRGFTGGFLESSIKLWERWCLHRMEFIPDEKKWQEMFNSYADLALEAYGVSGKYLDAMNKLMDLKNKVESTYKNIRLWDNDER